MSSLLTNTSAMTALQTLTATNKNLSVTQNRISTGMRVSNAADNAAYWSIATSMRSDNKALGAVQDALGLGAAVVDTAYTATTQIVDIAKDIITKVTAAGQSGVDLAKTQTDIGELVGQINNIVASANFNGVNWLDASMNADPQKIVASYSRAADNTVTLQTIDFDTNGTDIGAVLAATLAADVSGFSATDPSADAAALVSTLSGELAALTDSASKLGAVKNRVGLQQDFVKALKDSIDRGVGQLVDADMNAESTRLQALQTQQQLGIQALSIANQGSQSILSLFR